MLTFDPRVHPHYLCPWCKGKVSLCSPLTQGKGLTMLILDPRVNWNYPHPWCKGKVSLHLPLIQEVNPHFTWVHWKASIIALYYIILLLLSLYISSHLYIYLSEQKFSQFNYTYPKTLTQSGLNSTSLYTIFILSLHSGRSTFTLLQFVPLDTPTQNCPCPNTDPTLLFPETAPGTCWLLLLYLDYYPENTLKTSQKFITQPQKQWT